MPAIDFCRLQQCFSATAVLAISILFDSPSPIKQFNLKEGMPLFLELTTN
jgi:hypothetical protein